MGARDTQQKQFRGMAGIKGRATYTSHGEPVTGILAPVDRPAQHEQLPMFQSAHEVYNRLAGSVDNGVPGTDSWKSRWDRKLDEAKHDTYRTTDGRTTLYEDISKGGYTSHVHLHNTGGGWIHGQGHHRLAAGMDIENHRGEPLHVPVEHHATGFWDTRNDYSRAYPQNSDKTS